MKLGLALVACVAALGCERRTGDQQCRTDADALTRWLGTLNIESQLFIVDAVRLITRTDLDSRHLVEGPVLTIGAGETSFQGQQVGAADELASRLTASQQGLVDEIKRGRFAGGPSPDPRQLHLLVDEAAPWERVVAAALAAHRAGFTMPSFVFRIPPGPSTRPPRTSFDDAVERERAAGKLMQAPPPSASLFGRCSSMTRLFDQLGKMERGDKAETLVRGIGPALIDCSCKVDLPVLRSMLWHLLNNPNPVRGIAVETSPDALPIALPANTPWREANQRLTPTTKRAWFAIGS